MVNGPKPDLNRKRTDAKFQKGQSGNPKGRPKGLKDKRTKLRQLLQPKAKKLVEKVINLALKGDMTAMRLCLERIIPPIRAKDEQVNIPGLNSSQSLSEQAKVVMSGIGEGQLTPSEGAAILTAIASKARIDEIDELEKRLTALEEKRDAD